MPAADLSKRPAEWLPHLGTLPEQPVLLPESDGQLVTARILSSLGISVSLELKQPHWEELTDLLSYAIYGIRPHAPIEPFETWIAQQPQPGKHNEAFLQHDTCVSCPGWRACFGDWKEKCDDACREFFTELIDARNYRKQQTCRH